MIPSIVRLLRFASVMICVIVIASFAVFAVDQTKGASTKQEQQLSGGVPTATVGGSTPHSAESAPAREGGVRRAIDDASSWLTTPFSELTSASNGEWATRGTKLLLALVVYGFGLGYLARAIGVRV